MSLKSGGLTETEHQEREAQEAFREEIILAAIGCLERWRDGAEFLVPREAQIQLSSKGEGAWVDVKLWIDAGDVDHEWLEDVKNPPSVEECVDALKTVLNLDREGVPFKLLTAGLSLIARHQGKQKWVEARL